MRRIAFVHDNMGGYGFYNLWDDRINEGDFVVVTGKCNYVCEVDRIFNEEKFNETFREEYCSNSIIGKLCCYKGYAKHIQAEEKDNHKLNSMAVCIKRILKEEL